MVASRKLHMKYFLSAGVVWVGIWIAAIIGWVANIIQVIHLTSGPVTTLFILKCVGILAAPLGSILGWAGIL
jgi:hypothetical protein